MTHPSQAADAPATLANLQTAYYRALELAQFEGGFLARSSHELRSPLNQVISLQQMVLEGLCDSPEEAQDFIQQAHAAALKLLEYLDFLGQLSKLRIGRLQPTLQAVSLATALEQVRDLVHIQAANRNLRLHIEAPAASIQVWADPLWLRQALTTLIEVAIDSSDRGTLTLRLAPESPPKCHQLWLEDERPATAWQEPTPLPPPPEFDWEQPLSPALRLELAQTLLRAMQGKLAVLATPVDPTSTVTRLQCTLLDAAAAGA